LHGRLLLERAHGNLRLASDRPSGESNGAVPVNYALARRNGDANWSSKVRLLAAVRFLFLRRRRAVVRWHIARK
jgi:hypothetical protein